MSKNNNDTGFKVIDNKLVKDRFSYPIEFETVVGSVAYGTNVEGSDEDVKGVFVQPLEDKLLYGNIDQIEVDKDTIYYEFSKFIKLVSTGNPTMLELLFMPERCIKFISEKFKKIFYNNNDTRRSFLTNHCRQSYCGYAYQQIQKAGGLNKLMNFEKEGYYSKPKDVLDFCYVFNDKLGNTEPIKEVLHRRNFHMRKQENYGLAKCNNMVNAYFVYYFSEDSEVKPKGMIGNDSNEVRVMSIPKGMKPDLIMQFNHGAYKEHQKKHKQYKTWLKERNTQRYVDSQKHGQKIDGKNLLHCVRLLDMGEEIIDTNWLNVERSNAEDLKKIRFGEVKLDELLETCKTRLRSVEDKFRAGNLPDNVPPSLIRSIKKEFYGV